VLQRHFIVDKARGESYEFMPRHARLDAPGALQHAMIRGIEGTRIVRKDGDREGLLSLLTAYSLRLPLGRHGFDKGPENRIDRFRGPMDLRNI